jgi:hypothetical protein
MSMTPPWDEIRREYSTTRISLMALAAKYGIASKTALTRRAKAEGCECDETALAERQALADAVLDKLAMRVTLTRRWRIRRICRRSGASRADATPGDVQRLWGKPDTMART